VDGALLQDVARQLGVQVHGALRTFPVRSRVAMSSGLTSQKRSRCRAASRRSLPALATEAIPLCGEPLLRAEGEEVLLLGRHELRRVDRGQVVARPDHLADEVDVELLHVGLVLRVDVVEAALVHRHAADGPDRPVEVAAGDRLAAHAEELPALRREGDHGAPGHGRAARGRGRGRRGGRSIGTRSILQIGHWPGRSET
jgi:hypothetical protein